MGKKYKIGYTCGCFDLFHIGHLNLLERCKEMCDTLIVGICSDKYIREYKHKEPVYNQEDRRRIVESLKCVDEAIIVDIDEIENKLIIWNKLNFDCVFNGSDWNNSERLNRNKEDLEKLGVDFVFFPYTQGISTTKLRERIEK